MKGSCLQCGKPFSNRRGIDKRKKNRHQMFCSKECAGVYKHEHKPVCPECGRRHDGRIGESCCRCKKKIKAEAARHKVCDICGAEFVGGGARCSDECNKEYARRKTRKHDKARFEKNVKEKTCKWCGKVFAPEYGTWRRLYCSEECSQAAINDVRKAMDRVRKGKTTKISARGYHYNPISIRRLWLRDGGVCKICGKKVDWKLKRTGPNGPDPMSATRDHIIPIACGGEHTWENVRLAHFKCNWERGTGGNAQLLLFG